MRTSVRGRWLAVALLMALTACQGAASPSPSAPEPTPSPSPPTADEVIAAFVAVTGNPDLTMHVVADGKVTVTTAGGTDDLKIGFDMDISGADGVGKAVLDTGPSDLTFKMLVVGDHAYVDDNGTWTPVPNYKPTTPLNPFAGLSGPADVTYRGKELRDGRRVHHLSVSAWLGGDLSLLEDQGWSGVKTDYTLTTVLVNDDGVPITMDFSGGVSGLYQDVADSAAFAVSYTFSKVGEAVKIPSPT